MATKKRSNKSGSEQIAELAFWQKLAKSGHNIRFSEIHEGFRLASNGHFMGRAGSWANVPDDALRAIVGGQFFAILPYETMSECAAKPNPDDTLTRTAIEYYGNRIFAAPRRIVALAPEYDALASEILQYPRISSDQNELVTSPILTTDGVTIMPVAIYGDKTPEAERARIIAALLALSGFDADAVSK